MYAVSTDQQEVIETLRNLGANMNYLNDENVSPLAMALTRYISVLHDVNDWEKSFIPEESTWEENYLEWRTRKSFLEPDSSPREIKKKPAEPFNEYHKQKKKANQKKRKQNFVSDNVVNEYLFDNKISEENRVYSFIKDAVRFPEKYMQQKDLLNDIEKTILKLLENNADPNIGEVPLPPVFLAIFSRNRKVLKNSLSKKADVNKTSVLLQGISPIHFLLSMPISQTMYEMLVMLLKHGADPNAVADASRFFDNLEKFIDDECHDIRYDITPINLLSCRSNLNPQERLISTKMLEALVYYGADASRKFLGHNILILATLARNMDLIRKIFGENLMHVDEDDYRKLFQLPFLKKFIKFIPTEIGRELIELLYQYNAKFLEKYDGDQNIVDLIMSNEKKYKPRPDMMDILLDKIRGQIASHADNQILKKIFKAIQKGSYFDKKFNSLLKLVGYRTVFEALDKIASGTKTSILATEDMQNFLPYLKQLTKMKYEANKNIHKDVTSFSSILKIHDDIAKKIELKKANESSKLETMSGNSTKDTGKLAEKSVSLKKVSLLTTAASFGVASTTSVQEQNFVGELQRKESWEERYDKIMFRKSKPRVDGKKTAKNQLQLNNLKSTNSSEFKTSLKSAEKNSSMKKDSIDFNNKNSHKLGSVKDKKSIKQEDKGLRTEDKPKEINRSKKVPESIKKKQSKKEKNDSQNSTGSKEVDIKPLLAYIDHKSTNGTGDANLQVLMLLKDVEETISMGANEVKELKQFSKELDEDILKILSRQTGAGDARSDILIMSIKEHLANGGNSVPLSTNKPETAGSSVNKTESISEKNLKSEEFKSVNKQKEKGIAEPQVSVLTDGKPMEDVNVSERKNNNAKNIQKRESEKIKAITEKEASLSKENDKKKSMNGAEVLLKDDVGNHNLEKNTNKTTNDTTLKKTDYVKDKSSKNIEKEKLDQAYKAKVDSEKKPEIKLSSEKTSLAESRKQINNKKGSEQDMWQRAAIQNTGRKGRLLPPKTQKQNPTDIDAKIAKKQKSLELKRKQIEQVSKKSSGSSALKLKDRRSIRGDADIQKNTQRPSRSKSPITKNQTLFFDDELQAMGLTKSARKTKSVSPSRLQKLENLYRSKSLELRASSKMLTSDGNKSRSLSFVDKDLLEPKGRKLSKRKSTLTGDEERALYRACFECGKSKGKVLMLCPICKEIYFCSEKCNRLSLKRKLHKCNNLFYTSELRKYRNMHGVDNDELQRTLDNIRKGNSIYLKKFGDDTIRVGADYGHLPKEIQRFLKKLAELYPGLKLQYLVMPYCVYTDGQLYYRFHFDPSGVYFLNTYSEI